MSAIRSEDTKPEVELRKFLWSKGLRYRKYYGEEKIDIAFPKAKVALFVDGCFWHGCPLHSHIPNSNKGYWQPKLERNKQRDTEKDSRLQNKGWLVIRIWEHELSDLPLVYKKIYQKFEKASAI